MKYYELVGFPVEQRVTAEFDSSTKTVTITGNGPIRDGRIFKEYAEEIEMVIVSDGITIIGEENFMSYPALTKVQLSEFIEEIKDRAFAGCAVLKRIELPTGLQKIGYFVFMYCISLEYIQIKSLHTDYGMAVLGMNEDTALSSVTTGTAQQGYSKTSLINIPVSGIGIGYGRVENDERVATVEYHTGPDGNSKLPTAYWVFKECYPGPVISVENGENTGEYIGILIKQLPYKTIYGIGEEFDASGIEVVALTFEGEFVPVDISKLRFEGFGSMKVVKLPVTVIFTHTLSDGVTTEEFRKTFEVEVRREVIVTFVGLYGDVLSRQTVLYGESAVPPTPQEYEVFVFTGWSSSYESVKEDKVIQAQYGPKQFKVTFKRDYDGTVVETQMVYYGSDAQQPSLPASIKTDEGTWMFKGFDSDLSNITSDKTIFALYEKVTRIEQIIATDIIIKKGEEVQLKPLVQPENATNKNDLRYSTTDEGDKLIKLDDYSGRIIGMAKGSAEITISSIDDDPVTTTMRVTVTADDELRSLRLYPDDFSMMKGEKAFWSVVVDAGSDADSALLWTIDGAATINRDTGEIKAIKEGRAHVTVCFVGNPSIRAEGWLTVYDKAEYVDELYSNDSVKKTTVIESVENKFSKITDSDIVAESMVIKEAISTSAPLRLGGCIANCFEILVAAERFINKEPTGEIRVYQKINNIEVPLFRGEIYSAKRQNDNYTRKIVAYDQTYKAFDTDISDWYKARAFPITQKKLRRQLFKEIGIVQEIVTLPLDDEIIYNYYETYKKKKSDGSKKKVKIYQYDVPDELTAGDLIRGMCECNGVWGWLDRTGVFRYIKTSRKEWKGLHFISAENGDRYYPVKTVKYGYSGFESERIGSGKQKYYLDDSNIYYSFLMQRYYNSAIPVEGSTVKPEPFYREETSLQYTECEPAAKTVYKAMQELAEYALVDINVFQKFRPSLWVGDWVFYNKKEYVNGNEYTWMPKSVVMERTITGTQSMTETITARVGPYMGAAEKSGKAISYQLSSVGKRTTTIERLLN